MAIEKVINISVNSDDAVKGLEAVDASVDKIDESASNATKSTEGLGSSALKGAKEFKVMGVSINSVSKSLKLLKVSLIATGIGAIVVAVGALAAAFLSTQEGVDKLNSILKPLTEVLETAWGIVQKLGTGLFEMISGDITKGFDTMSKSVENLGDQFSKAYERGQELYELQIRIRNNQIEEIAAVTALNIQRAKALQIAEDTTQSEEERKKGYSDAIASEEAIAAIRKTILSDRIRELELSQEANDTSSDEFKELVQLRADYDNLEFDRITKITALTKRLNTVKAEAPDVTTEGDRSAVEQLETQYNDELLIIQDGEEAKTKVLLDELSKRIANEEALNKAKLEREEVLEQMAADAKLAIAANALTIVGTLAKEGSALAKGAAAAGALMNTYQGVTAALAAPSTIPEPFGSILKWANATAVGVAGAVNVKNILATDETGKNINTGSLGGSSVPSTPSFNLVQGTGADQIASNTSIQNDTPVKAYVVSSEVTTAQSLDRNAVGNATF